MRQRERRTASPLASAAALVVLLVGSACERDPLPTATADDTSPSLAAAAAAAPGATLLSQTTWGGADNDVAEDAAVAADGSTYLAGLTRSFGGSGTSKVLALKLAADGSVVWERTWDAPPGTFPFANDEGHDAAVAPDGSVYIAGFTFVDGNGALLLKFSAEGALLWQRTWGGGAHAEAVAVAADGSVYVVGSTRSFGAGEEDIFVVKLSPAGTLLWFKTWGAAGANEAGQGVAVGPDGSVYVAGAAPRPNDPFQFQFDALVLKLDPAGNLLWQRQYPGGDVTDARGGVAVAPDGSVYVGGGFQGPEGSNFANDGLVLKIAGSDGSLIWARQYDPGFVEGVAIAPDGRVVLVGQTSLGQGDDDAFLLRLEAGGKALDAFTWGGVGLDGGRGVGLAPDGRVSLAGFAEQPPYVFARAPAKTSRARISVSTPTNPLVGAAGVLSDPAGVVETPSGSTTYAGAIDAALVRIAP